MPTIEKPTPRQRSIVQVRYPAVAVPDEGPVPNPREAVTVEIEPPCWALASAYDVVRRAVEQSDASGRQIVVDQLLDPTYAHEEWVLGDGRDAVDAILAAATW